jgi:hypothetical protein
MSFWDYLIWGVAGLLLLPALVTPAGAAFAVVLAVGWLAVTYGGKYLLDLEKQRRQGERMDAFDVRQRGRGGNEK